MENKKEFNLLIGVTGSVAAIKIPLLVRKLKEKYEKMTIELVLTTNGEFFIKDNIIELENICTIYRDADEWNNWKTCGDPILHIQLMKDSDMMLLCPMDANSMAKIANGLSDNLLSAICRAWDFRKPILCAPAMNTLMWEHPVTSKQVNEMKSWGYEIIHPITKKLACGDTGIGAMAEVSDIIEILSGYIVG